MRRLRAVADALPRHERREAVLEQVDRRRRGCSRSSSHRRGRPSRRPARSGSTARFVPKKAEAPFFSDRSSRPSSARAAGRSPPSGPPSWRSPSEGTFWSQRPPSFRLGSKPIVVKTTGSPFARATSSSRLVASTCGVRSEPSAHSGSVKPQQKSTTRTAGREPMRDALAQPRLGVDLARFLVATSQATALAAGGELLADAGPPEELACAGLRRRARRSRRSPGRARARPRARPCTSVPSNRL